MSGTPDRNGSLENEHAGEHSASIAMPMQVSPSASAAVHGGLLLRVRRCACRFQPGEASDADLSALDLRLGPLAHARFEVSRSGEREAALARDGHEGPTQGMFAAGLDGRSQAEEVVGRRCSEDAEEFGAALGEGARLVEGDRVDLSGSLEGVGGPEQHTQLGAPPTARRNRRRGGETQGAGTRDDKHGNRRTPQRGSFRAQPGPKPRR